MKKYFLAIISLLLLSFNWNIGNAQNATCTRLQEERDKTEEKLVRIEARKFTFEDFFSLMDNPNSLTETSIPEEIANAEYRVRGLQRKITEGDNSPETAAALKSYQSRLKLLALRGSRSYDKNTFFKDPSYLEQEKIFNKLKSEELALKGEVVRIEHSMKSYNCEIKKKSDDMDDIDDNIIDKPKDEKDKEVMIDKPKVTSQTNPTIFTGAEVNLATKTISTNGGVVIVDNPGDPLNGLTIKIPENTYPDDRKFIITASPIKDHKLGTDFNPVSPLITISNGGGYSDGVMTITIPVNVPEGQFAMPFIYDEETGYLEGLPLLSIGRDEITFATRHFSKIIVAGTNEKRVWDKYETGFSPGIDDWQMGNPSTVYLSNGGQCSGQSIGMLWYYNEKRKKGEPSLNGRYDNDGVNKTPRFWQDDVLALKFCALLQQGDYEHRFDNKLFGDYLDKQKNKTDRQTMRQFASAFQTNQKPRPQFLLLNDKTKTGHAVVVYKMENGTLFIADPNVPGLERKIEFDKKTNKYKPYRSGGSVFTNFSYMGESALLSFDKVSQYWRKVEDGTIGDKEFPQYRLITRNDAGDDVPLTNGSNIREKFIILTDAKNNEDFTMKVYNKEFRQLPMDGWEIQLPQGKHRIGIEVVKRDGGWVGFDWLDIEVITASTLVNNVDLSELDGDWEKDTELGVQHFGFPIHFFHVEKNDIRGRWGRDFTTNRSGKITGGSYDETTKVLSFTYIQALDKKTGTAKLLLTETATEYKLRGTWKHDDGSGSGGLMWERLK